jgi:hypothetical protein
VPTPVVRRRAPRLHERDHLSAGPHKPPRSHNHGVWEVRLLHQFPRRRSSDPAVELDVVDVPERGVGCVLTGGHRCLIATASVAAHHATATSTSACSTRATEVLSRDWRGDRSRPLGFCSWRSLQAVDRLAAKASDQVVRFVVTDGEQVEYQVDHGDHLLVRAEAPVTVFVTAPSGCEVTMGGTPLPVLRSGGTVTAACRVDGARVIGAVRVEAKVRSLRPARLDVLIARADDALQEFLRTTRLIEIALPRLRGSFTYVDSTGNRVRFIDPVRVATFVRDQAAGIAAAARAIDADPATGRVTMQNTRPPGARVNVPATRRFLAGHPQFLQPSASSVIDVEGPGYAPVLVRTDRRISTLDIDENRRIARFLSRLWRDARTAIRSDVLPLDVAGDLREAGLTIEEIMATTLFGDLPGPEDEDALLEPSPLERADSRYENLHRLRVHYLTEITPNVDSDQLDRQHLARPDEVYQSMCTVLVAAAFDLSPYTAAGGLTTYRNDVWELFPNTSVSLRSWREHTLRPDEYRPDLVLRRRATPTRCILIDAKYSEEAGQGPPGDQLKEVQAYMNAFGLHRAGVLYPGDLQRVLDMECRDITGHGSLLREIPLRAVEPDDLPHVLTSLRARLLDLEDEAPFGVPA